MRLDSRKACVVAVAGVVLMLAGCKEEAKPGADEATKSAMRETAKLAVVTRSEKGCVVIAHEGAIAVPAAPIERVADVTGAGDLFAAGFLTGLARGKDHRTAAQLGALAAAEVIQHIGARPEVSLKALAAENGLAV